VARVSLQITVAPSDLPHAGAILPHQLRTWAAQVDEVLFTYDVRPPARGRFTDAWEERRAPMAELLEGLCAEHPHARVAEVDDRPKTVAAVGRRFLDREDVPQKDSRGGPLYAYFFALHEAAHDLVLHMDSDMLFGGASQTWVREAVELLAAREDVLFAGPLPGPPRADGTIAQPGERVALDSLAFSFRTMSTRVFLLDRGRLAGRVGPLRLRPPILLRSRIKARLHGHPPFAMPEQLLSLAMEEHGMSRVDFLGEPSGMWSLHPPHRSQRFYDELPELVRRVEAGDVPDEQRGHYDIVDALVDWSDARAAERRGRLVR
jgi:hypothetical protein